MAFICIRVRNTETIRPREHEAVILKTNPNQAMNKTLEVKLSPNRTMVPMSSEHEELMQRHLREENLPQAVMPVTPINKVLKGQKALVTGANSGIGKAVAVALANAGADVVVNYVSRPEAAEELVHHIVSHGGNAFAIRANVAKEEEVEGMFEKMIREFGTIDILVNNAGLQKDARIEDMTLADWQFVLDVNLTGQFLCAREAIREFKRRGIRKEVSCAAGKIICMSSVHEVIPWAGHVNYAASKGGVMLMMKSIAQEVAPHRIRVNSVCPGAVRTPINMEAWGTPEAYRELMKLIPYKRIGEPDDIGRAAVWLASDDSDYIHGASIFVDGGMTLYPGFETGG
jgi:glucose 1-dehydrogenase